MPSYRLSYIITATHPSEEASTLVGDFIADTDYEVTKETYGNFREFIAGQLECDVRNLVIVSFGEIRSDAG